MTLDEAIEQFKYDAECNRADLDLSFAEDNDKVAEWLEELKAYKSDDFTSGLQTLVYKQGCNKAIDDFVKALCIEYVPVSDEMQKEYDNVCSRFEKIAEQLKAGVTNASQ